MGGSEEKQGWRVCCTRRSSRSAGRSTSNRRSSLRPSRTRWWWLRGNTTAPRKISVRSSTRRRGQIDVYSVHTVVEEVADPLREISLADARKQKPDIEVGGEITADEADRRAGKNRGANRQAGDPAEGARGRARHDLQRIPHARGRADQQRREAHGRPGPDRGPRAHGSAAAEARAIAAGGLQRGRPPARDDSRGRACSQGAASDRVARRSRPGAASFRNGSAGNLRRHGADSRRGARSGRAHENRASKAATRTSIRWARAWA